MTDFTTSTSDPDAALLKARLKEEAAKAVKAAPKSKAKAKDPIRPYPGRITKTKTGHIRKDN